MFKHAVTVCLNGRRIKLSRCFVPYVAIDVVCQQVDLAWRTVTGACAAAKAAAAGLLEFEKSNCTPLHHSAH